MSFDLKQYNEEQIAKFVSSDIDTSFCPGDTLELSIRVKIEKKQKKGSKEGISERIQKFTGVCIGRKNSGCGSTFKILNTDLGIELTRPLYSESISGIKILKKGRVRRAKLYYLRNRVGKSARIPEKRRKRVV